MNKSTDQITEAQLKERICGFKDSRDYRGLTSYLIRALSSGQVPTTLQAKAFNELGLAHLQLDEPLEAEKGFLSAIERDPKAVNPRFNRANLALYAQKYTHAFGLFQEVLSMAPDHAGAMFHAGLCLAMNERPVEALPYFESSAKQAPDAMGPSFWAGESLVALKRFEDALTYFRHAAEITPDHRESQRGVAICLLETARFDECVEQCDLLILSGGGAEYLAYRIKGDALIEQGEVEAGAVCHLQLAELDFDARDYLVLRGKDLAAKDPEQGSLYQSIVADRFKEMNQEFLEINAIAAAAGSNVQCESSL